MHRRDHTRRVVTLASRVARGRVTRLARRMAALARRVALLARRVTVVARRMRRRARARLAPRPATARVARRVARGVVAVAGRMRTLAGLARGPGRTRGRANVRLRGSTRLVLARRVSRGCVRPTVRGRGLLVTVAVSIVSMPRGMLGSIRGRSVVRQSQSLGCDRDGLVALLHGGSRRILPFCALLVVLWQGMGRRQTGDG